ncbi:unnamed protein product [Paramecium sonneborni]|uniref:Transmembrane protein n=1 Tax=Paramecium sonneborni TaxID=65129 RepID=A0A8S1P8T5_9CILI|nr:unnamed protein product [Paramecium sonneborni]
MFREFLLNLFFHIVIVLDDDILTLKYKILPLNILYQVQSLQASLMILSIFTIMSKNRVTARHLSFLFLKICIISIKNTIQYNSLQNIIQMWNRQNFNDFKIQLNTSMKLLINFMSILNPILPPQQFRDKFLAIARKIGKLLKILLYLIHFLAYDLEIEINYLKIFWAALIPIIQITIIFAHILINRIIKNFNVKIVFIQAYCIFLMCQSKPNIMQKVIVIFVFQINSCYFKKKNCKN